MINMDDTIKILEKELIDTKYERLKKHLYI